MKLARKISLWPLMFLILSTIPSGYGQSLIVGRIVGSVVSRDNRAPLPGVEITCSVEGATEPVFSGFSGDTGDFEVPGLVPGAYSLVFRLPGFETLALSVNIEAGEDRSVTAELALAALTQTVDVVAQQQQEVPETATSQATLDAELINIQPVRGDDFSSLLPLLPGVVRAADGRINMKGGGATQSSLVVNNSSNVTDPSTGDRGFSLPVDAIQTVDVLPNPYAAEFGRFSAGVTNILTRQGNNEWKFLFNNFIPKPKFRDGSILGIAGFTPRLGFRGPLVKDRLFIAQTFQYRILKTKVPGQPDLKNDKHLESFDSFSQIDAQLNDNHSLSAVVSFFPRKLDFQTLDSFNPLEVTANVHQQGYNIGVSERATLSANAYLESTVGFRRFDVDVFGQGFEDMVLAPDGNSGNFFNIQRRKTRSWQWVESLSLYKPDWKGEHLFKFGVDLLHSRLDGESSSRPVRILRADGSLSQTLTFTPTSSQRESATDLALFAQDRWRLNDRLILEIGTRIDRDGTLERTNFSPRAGFVLSVLPEGRGVIRGGAGYFYERVPLNVAGFETYERPILTRFLPGGEEPSVPPIEFALVKDEDLRTPYSFIWNLEYDHKLSPDILLKANFLRRAGFNETILDPLNDLTPQLRLSTRGRSRYWELELTGRYTISEEGYLLISYVRSRSEKDLNAFDNFYGSFRNPIVRPNEFSFADTDAPHRFLFQGTIVLPGKWLFSPVVEIRSGFPYSFIDEDRNYVGPRNQAGRFPTLATVDIDIQRRFKIWRWNTRLGFRVFQVLNTFNPRDFQGNIDSTNFGVFTNTLERQFGLNFQIENF